MPAEETVVLASGRRMPRLALGVFKIPAGASCVEAVLRALEAGYRHVDTAAAYQNERSVGEALARSGLPRGELFVTTKVWISDYGRRATRHAVRESLQRLGTGYLDLCLLHWPVDDTMMEAWEALQALREEGVCRDIGVSNWTVQRFLESFLPRTRTLPAVNQVEFHPFRSRPHLLEFCRSRGIAVQAYSPLARGRRLDDPTLLRVAREAGRTPAQVLLRWALQHGAAPVVKAADPRHLRENAQVFDFELTRGQLDALDLLNEDAGVSAWRPCPPNEWY